MFKRSARIDMSGQRKGFMEHCESDWSLTKLKKKYGVCTNQNLSKKILWDFSILTDHQIQARRPHPVLLNKKKTCQFVDIVNFSRP